MKRHTAYKAGEFNPTGVFESLRSYDGRIFKLEEHLDRLRESAKSLGAELSKKDILNFKEIIENKYKKSRIKNAYIRIAVSSPLRNITLIIKKIKPYPEIFYKNGVSLTTSVLKRPAANTPAGRVKSSNFLSGICAHIDSLDSFERLLLQGEGYVAEATVSNIFIVKDKNIFTPPASDGLLNGITRQTVLDLAKAIGINASESRLTRHDLYNADECFLTNTTMQVLPVIAIDARIIGSGRPGNLTKRLMREFNKLTNF